MMMGGRAVTRSLRYSILSRRSRHVASDALLSRSPSPSASSPFESRLRTILRSEIQYQYDYAPPNQPFTEFGRFVVEDVGGKQWIRLRLRGKSGEDENIKIEATMFDGSILAPKSKSGDEEDVRLHISMLVDIWRGKEETDLMEFVCSAWPDSMEIHKVYKFNRPAQPQPQPYMGPDIKDLSNSLRAGLYEFLDARGINSDLSRFLHQYMMNKDRIELIHWLGKLQSYIEK